MPLLTTVIDDKSPLIQYDDTWLPGTSQDDGYAIDYYYGTFQKNSATNGVATFDFNGTAIWVYGANRPNHGTYTVQLDGGNIQSFNGFNAGFLFQQTLFTASANQAVHSIKFTNTGSGNYNYVDIDMIVWQSEVGNPGDSLVPEIIQDGDGRFQYQSGAWGTSSSNANVTLNLFNNGTGHITDTSDATVSLTFSVCEAVTLYGIAGPASGPYSAQLDGGQNVQYNAANAYPTSYGVALFHADNLGPGNHQVVLTNLPSQSGQALAIDYAQVWMIANSPNSSNVTVCPTTSTGNNLASTATIPSGAIAGLVVEGVVAVIAAAAALFFYLRWRAALDAPQGLYTPFYRTPETGTGTGTGTGIAPSLDAGSNATSPQNRIAFQPVMAQTAVSPFVDARPEGASLPSEGQVSVRRSLPAVPTPPSGAANTAGHTSDGWSTYEGAHSNPPPGYDTAIRQADA